MSNQPALLSSGFLEPLQSMRERLCSHTTVRRPVLLCCQMPGHCSRAWSEMHHVCDGIRLHFLQSAGIVDLSQPHMPTETESGKAGLFKTSSLPASASRPLFFQVLLLQAPTIKLSLQTSPFTESEVLLLSQTFQRRKWRWSCPWPWIQFAFIKC